MTGERKQLLSALTVSVLSVGVGAAMVWTSPYLAYLKSPESPLSSPITSHEAAMIGGIMPLGALIGSFLYGKLADLVGRFWTLYLNAIPQIIWWLTVIFTKDLTVLYYGRFFAGLAIGGAYTLVPLYLTEVSSDKIRGSLNAIFVFSMNLGMLLIYVSGEFLEFYTAQKLFLMLPITFIVLFVAFPETPIYLLKNGKSIEAEKSLKYFRGIKKSDESNSSLLDEMTKLKKKVDESLSRKSSWKEVTSPVALKALFYGTIIVSLHQFSGLLAFIGYTSDIFRESGSSLSPNMSAIIVGVLLIAGSIFSVIVMDKCTRKFLFTLTSLGNIVGLLIIGGFGFMEQFYDLSAYGWIPIFSTSLVILSCSAGRFPLAYLIVAEIQPQNNRSFGISVSSAVNWFVAFLVMRYFSLAVELFKFYNCMFLFCISLFLNLFFVLIFIPETKGKSYDEIESLLTPKSQRAIHNSDEEEAITAITMKPLTSKL